MVRALTKFAVALTLICAIPAATISPAAAVGCPGGDGGIECCHAEGCDQTQQKEPRDHGV
jgi:hypothetical protein